MTSAAARGSPHCGRRSPTGRPGVRSRTTASPGPWRTWPCSNERWWPMRAMRILKALVLGLAVALVAARAPGDGPAVGLKLEKAGAKYTWAQVSSWLDREHFAVGRWDGTITLFR